MWCTWLSSQDAIETQFKSAFCQSTWIGIQIAQSSGGEHTVRLLSLHNLFCMESAFVYILSEHGQFLAFLVLDVCGKFARTDVPCEPSSLFSFQQVISEPCCIMCLEYICQSYRDAVEACCKSRVSPLLNLLLACGVWIVNFEVHVQTINGYRTGKHLPVGW